MLWIVDILHGPILEDSKNIRCVSDNKTKKFFYAVTCVYRIVWELNSIKKKKKSRIYL